MNNRFTTVCALIAALFFGCGDNIDDTEEVELGQAEQPMTVEISPGVTPIMGAPRVAFSGTWAGLSRCTATTGSATNITGCKGGFVMYVPSQPFIHYIVPDSITRQYYASACGTMLASGSNRGCAAENGSFVCGSGMTCVTVNLGSLATNFTGGGFDFRNYFSLACTSNGGTASATFQNNSYTVQSCPRYSVTVDHTKMRNDWGLSGDETRRYMLAHNILLQTIGVGGYVSSTSTTMARWTFPSAPTVGQASFWSAGEQCRSNNMSGLPPNLTLTTAHNCAFN